MAPEDKQELIQKISQDDLPPNAVLSFDNEGKVVVKNRAFRRKRMSLYPKSSQMRKKNKRKK